MQAAADDIEARTRDIIGAYLHREGPALPMLHAIQAEFGYVPAQSVPVVAHALNQSRAEIHGLVSFYHDFRHEPAGRNVLRLCRAEACQSRGADALAAHASEALGLGWHETTQDGAITLEPIFCLGLCAAAPCGMIDGQTVARLDEAKLDASISSPALAGEEGAQLRSKWEGEGQGLRIFVPRDALADSLGAAAIAAALQAACPDSTIIRTGSRGMAWLEPLIEIETPEGRIGYGPVQPSDIPGLLEAGFLTGAGHPLRIGRPEAHPFLARQTRITFKRCGITDPLSLDDYRAHGGLKGLQRALTMTQAAIVDEVTNSGLRGRGGAGFPTGIKWRTTMQAVATQKYIVANADEGDSGTFADRMIMEGDPFLLIEGMIIAGIATGATKGFVYLRSEYPHAIAAMNEAVAIAQSEGILGDHVLGSDVAFDMEIRVGAGAYVCGEETSLLDSLEGKRGQVRAKPPLPAITGLFGKPTIVNNVLSLVAVPDILADGAEAYKAHGYGRSRGTMPIQLAGNIKHGGLFEVPFGITLGELVEHIGGGTASGRPVRAVQVGGPLGAYFPPSLFDTVFDYEAFTARDGLIGHGGVVVFDDTVDMARMARFAMEFCAVESCGKCTPCRIGSTRGVEVIDRMLAGVPGQAELLTDLCDTMKFGSLCALGGFTPYPVMSAFRHFPEDFSRAPAQVAA